MARGAVVVVFSDGWERGDGAELGEQLARLRRLAHRVVWVNPHRGKLGYEPVQAGIVAALLGEQMQRLHRLAHRVVWVNPHRGKAGYQPVQQGIVAALPYVDRFVAGHSLQTFAELIEVVAHA
jgi:uncharacterized protein with von Willebrand factor type A (vWA) domain